jgi:hypothetical protein
MANALRRKMFKMGGNVPKTHGVGITSGLKMKKGGRVEPQATFGVGNNALKKVGPDGKQREAHVAFIPAVLGGGGAGAAILGTLGRLGLGGLGRFVPQFIKRRIATDPRGISGFFRGDPITKRFTGKGGKPYDLITDIPSTTRGAKALRALQLSAAPATLGVTGAGIVSAALPDIPENVQQRVPLANLAQGFRDVLLEPTASLSPLGALTFGLTGKGIAGNVESLVGKDKKIGPKSVPESDPAETQRKQKDEFAGLQDKAERMAAAITRENNLAVLSKAASDFGAAALSGEDLAGSLRAGSAGIFDELGRRRDIQENIGGILAQQVLADEATQSAMIAEAAKTGDPQAVNRMQKYFDAYNEGVTNILPIDAKGKPDYANMAPATVYMDLEGVTGGRYFASNADGSSTQPFDSVEDANAFTQS